MSWQGSLPASRAQRRSICPGSHYLESLYPETEKSESAEEGILAHEAACLSLRSCLLNKLEPDLSNISDEMRRAVDIYCNDVVAEYFKNKEYVMNFGIEERLHGGVHPLNSGIADFFMIVKPSDDVAIIYTWDFKYGHKGVNAENNMQLLSYALAVCQKLENREQLLEVNFVLTIVQPRVFGTNRISRWTIGVNQLAEKVASLRTTEELALTEKARCYVSPECFTCRARHACPTLREAATLSVDVALGEAPYVLQAPEIGDELRILTHCQKVLEMRINGLSQQALKYVKDGKRVNFYRAESSISRLSWSASNEELKALEEIGGVKLFKEELITPLQAIDAGLPDTLIQDYAKRKTGELKLVQETEQHLKKLFK